MENNINTKILKPALLDISYKALSPKINVIPTPINVKIPMMDKE